MNFHRLKIFACVARHLNETKAAKELHLSQSALSRHLRALQEGFGTLLKNNGRGLELTPRGEAFYNEIQPMLARVDSLGEKYGAGERSEKIEKLVIGSCHAPATFVLPCALWAFKQQNPATDTELRVSSSPDIQELVVNSGVDLAVVTNPAPLDSLVMEPFIIFRLCFFVARDHPLASAKEVSVERLARYPLVIGRVKKGRSRSDELLSSMTAGGVKLDVLMRCEWPDAVKAVVRAGEAVGVLYRDSIERGVSSGEFKILTVIGVNLSVISYILYPRDTALSETAQKFLRVLRAQIHNTATKLVLRST